MWHCYILKSLNPTHKNKTYNGATNNPERRIRQHNGELVGGAKATLITRPNEIYCIISGFQDNIECLQCEWRIKHPTNSRIRPKIYSGIEGRIKGLKYILQQEKFTNNSLRLIKDIQLDIYIKEEYIHLLNDLSDNIHIHKLE